MVEVNLWAGLRPLVDGKDKVEVEARTVGEVLMALARDFPALQPAIDAGVSVAVDGKIYAYGLTEPVTPQSEIYLMQRIRGG